MSELILLGAGASVEAEIPSAYDMSKKLLGLFAADQSLAQHTRVLRFVAGGLLFQHGVSGTNPFDGLDVEDLFNAVQQLADRNSLEIAPFVGSWHPVLDELEAGIIDSHDLHRLLEDIYEPLLGVVRRAGSYGMGGQPRDIDNAIQELIDRRPFARAGQLIYDMARKPFDELSRPFALRPGYDLSDRLVSVVRQAIQSQGGRFFARTCDLMLRQLANMVWIQDAAKVSYLTPMVKHARRNAYPIVTLNYDNSIELAGITSGVAVDTGFGMWSQDGEFRQGDTANLFLLKLHGSIDWSLSPEQQTSERPMPHQIIKVVEVNQGDPSSRALVRPAVIFGGRSKLTAKGPFLALLNAFKRELSTRDRLTIIGYSFRDEHVNEYIGEWLNASQQRVIRIVNPSFLSLESAFAESLRRLPEQRIQVLAKKASEAIAELMAMPEQ